MLKATDRQGIQHQGYCNLLLTGELSAGVGGAVKDIHQRIAAFLTTQACPNNSFDTIKCQNVFKDDWADALDHHDGILVGCCHCLDEGIAVMLCTWSAGINSLVE